MIKFILNGFFRSGTTILWKIMRDSNPDMYVFCEPLHNELFLEIHREQSLKECGHGYPTTNEYVEQGGEFLKRLRQLHPSIGGRAYCFKIDDIIRYLKIFDSLDKPVVLQPNRMHFILSDVAKAFDCKVAHVIRHPLDVFLSVMFSSPKLKRVRSLFGVNPYELRLFRNPNPYFLDEQCNFISRYFGLRPARMSFLYRHLHPKIFYLKRFILVWTVTNWYAVTEIDASNGLIVRYEDIVSIENTLQYLASFAGIKIDSSKVKLHRNSISKYRDKDFDLCFMLADKMRIGDKFRYLVERFDYGS